MEIEITHESSFVNMDAVITHNGERIVIPMGFKLRGNSLVDHVGQLVSELNQHWARRSDESKKNIFAMYRCLRRCWENRQDYSTDRVEENRVFVKEAVPYMQRLLNEHNVGILSAQLENLYQDIIPHSLPDDSNMPTVYTYEEYSQLLAMLLSIRSIWPAVEMLKSGMTSYPRDEKETLIWSELIQPGVNLYHSAALRRLHTYIDAYVKKNGHGDTNELVAKVMLRRLTKYPIVSAPEGTNVLAEIYKFVSMETHSGTDRDREKFDGKVDAPNKFYEAKFTKPGNNQ